MSTEEQYLGSNLKEMVIRMAPGESPCSVIGQGGNVVIMGERMGGCD